MGPIEEDCIVRRDSSVCHEICANKEIQNSAQTIKFFLCILEPLYWFPYQEKPTLVKSDICT